MSFVAIADHVLSSKWFQKPTWSSEIESIFLFVKHHFLYCVLENDGLVVSHGLKVKPFMFQWSWLYLKWHLAT